MLSVQFDSAAAFAKVVDALSADPEFRAWQSNNAQASQISWVRSNHARELALG